MSENGKPEKSKADIAETALKRFKYVAEVWANQIKREQEDLRFQDPDEQWTPAARAERDGGRDVGGQLRPARPRISISKLNQPYQLIRNAQRQAKLGVNLHPRSEDADPKTAEIIQGIYRSIEQESHADQARGWAFGRASWAGRGCYRVTTDYDDEGGNPFDQVIRIERIPYQDSVYLDPAAKNTDYSDGDFAFVKAWVPIEKWKALYPDAKVPDADDPLEWSIINQQIPEWVKSDEGGRRSVLTVEYWYKTYELQTFVELDPETGETAIEEELPEDQKPPKEARRRKHLLPTVWQCILGPGGTPLQFLDGPNKWMGQYIPLVPVIGEELQPFDEQRRYCGLVYSNRDAQRAYNYAASTVLERMALEPKAPFLLDPEQIEDYKAQWDNANTRNYPYLPFRRFKGNLDYGVPQRAQVDTTGTSLALMGLQTFNDFIQAGTFAYDPSLGQSQPQRSGKAIMAEQQQFEISSSGYLYNLGDISMNYEARIVLDLIPKVYDRPGRIAQILDEEDQSQSVMLNAPYYEEPETGRMMPVNGQMPYGAEQKHYDLSKGVYSVTITVGKSFQSLRQEGGQVIGEILQAHPEWMGVLGPLWAKFQDFPGSREFMDVLLKLRGQQFPFLNEPGSPEQLQAELMQAQQQMQAMGQQMQAMQQALETKQVEQQGRMAEAQMDQQTQMQKAQIDQQTKLAIATMDQRVRQIEMMLKGVQEQRAIQAKTEGDVAKIAAEAVLKPPDLTFRGSADVPLPKDDRF